MTNDRTLIKNLDESVAQLNILSDCDLIKLAMNYIDEIPTQETVPTLISFCACLRNYNLKTNHLHEQGVNELVFKIDNYLCDDIKRCAQ